jgi:hypothetical protein
MAPGASDGDGFQVRHVKPELPGARPAEAPGLPFGSPPVRVPAGVGHAHALAAAGHW